MDSSIIANWTGPFIIRGQSDLFLFYFSCIQRHLMWVWTICQPSWLSNYVLLYLMPSLVFCRPFPFDVLGGLLTLNVSSSRSLPFLLPIPSAASLPPFHAPLKIGNDTVSHLNYIAFHNSLGVSLVKQETYWLSLPLHSCQLLKTPMG